MLIVYIHNVSKGVAISDYEYEVCVNEKRIARGNIKGHRRKDGWAALVQKLIDKHKGE